jgi:outer membrane immunogenic protein
MAMSKLGLGIAAGALLVVAGTQISHSADMGVRAAPPPVLATCPGGPFSGFWVGGNLDWAYYKAERTDQDGLISAGGSTISSTKSAVAGGVGGGWDWQCRNRVFGVIADWSGTSAKASTNTFPNLPGVADLSVNSKLNWYGTLRTRGGLTVDDILIYLTGGLAYANIETTWNTFAPPVANSFAFKNTPWGFVVGVGAETMLWNRWSLKSEILYMQFQEKTFTGTVPAVGSFSVKNNDSLWVSRIALNYRF